MLVRTARTLALLAALPIGCARPTAKRAATPAATASTPPPPTLADVPTCADGKFVAVGEALPKHPGVLGTAPEASTVKRACAAHPAIEKCRSEKLPGKSAFRGTLTLALEVDAAGKVVAAKRTGGTIDDGELTKCVEAALATTAFTVNAPGTLSYQLELSRWLRVVKIIETGTDIRGRIDPRDVKVTIRRNFVRLRGCYEQLLKTKGDIDGLLTFDLVIQLDGKLKSLNVDFSESFNDKPLLDCMADAMSSLVFPEPESLVWVRYPLRFETTVEEAPAVSDATSDTP